MVIQIVKIFTTCLIFVCSEGPLFARDITTTKTAPQICYAQKNLAPKKPVTKPNFHKGDIVSSGAPIEFCLLKKFAKQQFSALQVLYPTGP